MPNKGLLRPNKVSRCSIRAMFFSLIILYYNFLLFNVDSVSDISSVSLMVTGVIALLLLISMGEMSNTSSVLTFLLRR